jgi:hypothetical protein
MVTIKTQQSLEIIADEFASTTFSIEDNELQWEITAHFTLEELRKYCPNYETYIPE